MNSFELNKIMGAILGTLLFVMGVGFLAEAIYHPIEDRGPGYSLPEPEGTEAAEGPAEEVIPVSVLLAEADAEAGAAASRRCQSCHNFNEGEGNKTGPELYGVVGRPIASHEGYAYSDALLEHGSAGETWTYEHLDAFLANPQTFAPGTKMNLAVRDAAERADLLAYLQTLAADPVPFPEPEELSEEAAEEISTPTEDEDLAEPEVAPEVEGATATPTETEDESPGAGTPTGGGAGVETDAAPADDAEAAPEAETEAAPVNETPATEAPATEAPATDAPAAEPTAAPDAADEPAVQ
jgi:cytochrome c